MHNAWHGVYLWRKDNLRHVATSNSLHEHSIAIRSLKICRNSVATQICRQPVIIYGHSPSVRIGIAGISQRLNALPLAASPVPLGKVDFLLNCPLYHALTSFLKNYEAVQRVNIIQCQPRLLPHAHRDRFLAILKLHGVQLCHAVAPFRRILS